MSTISAAELARAIAERLAAKGILLSSREQRRLEQFISKRTTSEFLLKPKGSRRRIALTLEEEDTRLAEGRLEKVFERLPKAIRAAIDKASTSTLKRLKSRWPAESRRQRVFAEGFRKRLDLRWGEPIEGLRLLLTIAREFGSEINVSLRKRRTKLHLIDALTRLHARACQVTEEVLSLLAAGLADGAMARWRTLHEIAVVSTFIRQKGNTVAARYLEHNAIESRKAALEFQTLHQILGYEAIEATAVADLESTHKRLLEKYGTGFASQYGWAAASLKIKRPTFADIEHRAGMSHLRSHYRMASHNVHANPKGLFFKLGLMSDSRLLLSGPSNAGLADPGHCAAISLFQISAQLGALVSTVDATVQMKIMQQLEKEIGAGFARANKRLKTDEAKLRKQPRLG